MAAESTSRRRLRLFLLTLANKSRCFTAVFIGFWSQLVEQLYFPSVEEGNCCFCPFPPQFEL